MLNPSSQRWRSHARRVAVIAAVAFGALAVPAAPSGAASPQLTFVTAAVPNAPKPVTATDGRRHLVYEIWLQNLAGAPLELETLTVSGRGGRALQRFAGPEIAGILTTSADGPTTTLGPDVVGTIWLDVALDAGRRPPRGLVHRFVGRAIPAAPDAPVWFAFAGARTRVGVRRPVGVAPPLRGRRFADINGCCGLSPHRTGLNAIDGVQFLAQRFAIDFLRIDRRGRAFVGDIGRNESFLGFRDPVYAVADGRVVAARDDLRENTPPEEPPPLTLTPTTALGNHVVLALGGGRYALYAHLHTGSVRVRPGQPVHRGQMLARVGNTGESGAPHLHFHITDGPSPLASDGLPFAFTGFRWTGTIANLDEFLTGEQPARVRARPAATQRRRDQMPLQATVLDFPD